MSSSSQRRLVLLCGVFGPVVFTIVVAAVGATRSHYSHVSQFISELGETGAELGWIMNYFGFMLSGSLILIFVLASRSLVTRGSLNVLGSLFLATFAVCMILAGIYSCDLGCSPVNPTPEQKLHGLVSMIAFPAFIVGVTLWGAMFFRDSDWRVFGVYSLASAGASVIILVAMIESEPTREGTGFYQRLFLATLFVWLITLSIRLWRQSLIARSD